MSWISGLYAGVVSHARLKPRPHRLRYRVFMLLLDLDEAPAVARALSLFSTGRFNLTGFRESDHGDGSGRPLKVQVEAALAEAGIEGGGPVRLLAMPRILGGVFNPLSVYFCSRRDGSISAILYEVNNTFGQRHSYLIPAEDGPDVRQSCAKDFYVSPFMDMGLTYDFRIRPPRGAAGEAMAISIEVRDSHGPVLIAAFNGRRAELSDAALLGAWLAHPWMTLGVMAAIHWEALKVWSKGERVRRRPPSSPQPLGRVAS